MKPGLRKGQKAAGIATIVTIFLSLSKGLVGYLSGSLLLLADAIHSGVDILAIFASWFGLKVSQREANQKFPFGYYKAENLATIVVVGFIFYAAYGIFWQSWERLSFSSSLNLPAVTLAVSLLSAIISYFVAVYEQRIGREINSQSLIANAQESKMDVFSSMAVFVGLVFSYFKIGYIEGIVGIVLSFLIFKIGWQSARAALFSLMDASPDIKLEEKIKKLILSIRGAKDVKHIKLRQSGAFIFGEAHLKVSKNMDVEKAHKISEIIEVKIKRKYPEVDSFLIHIEPHRAATEKILIPLKHNHGLDSEVVGHFARARYFLSVVWANERIKSWRVKKNPFAEKKIRAGLAVSKHALAEKIDVIVLRQIGEVAFHTLRNNYIDIYLTQGKTAREVIKNYGGKKLKKLNRPTHLSSAKIT